MSLYYLYNPKNNLFASKGLDGGDDYRKYFWWERRLIDFWQSQANETKLQIDYSRINLKKLIRKIILEPDRPIITLSTDMIEKGLAILQAPRDVEVFTEAYDDPIRTIIHKPIKEKRKKAPTIFKTPLATKEPEVSVEAETYEEPLRAIKEYEKPDNSDYLPINLIELGKKLLKEREFVPVIEEVKPNIFRRRFIINGVAVGPKTEIPDIPYEPLPNLEFLNTPIKSPLSESFNQKPQVFTKPDRFYPAPYEPKLQKFEAQIAGIESLEDEDEQDLEYAKLLL